MYLVWRIGVLSFNGCSVLIGQHFCMQGLIKRANQKTGLHLFDETALSSNLLIDLFWVYF